MLNKAISVRSPWWWFILRKGKDIENRPRPWCTRGTIYLHASKWWNERDFHYAMFTACQAAGMNRYPDSWPDIMAFMKRSRGCIVGKIDIVDCVQKSTSPWFFGPNGLVLRKPVALVDPVSCKGALGPFTVPDSVLSHLERAEWRT